ncbi:unnamed protein product [Rotaria sordida]|uniref:DNA helicase n=1 Tax=Rotaria sordida TaxID=392033 RepID=A0A814ZZB8_9BILA|nr:unnamed protein product [Rotaria sordida]
MRWINDECQVICATVAFGMGIDKNNGYYQESGRAGRDAEIANCHLFYCYEDFIKMKRLILYDDELKCSMQTKQVRININRVYDYCLNKVICRRTQLLEYFGELFSSSECKRIMSTECDNCRQVYKTSSIDCTRISIEILKLVSDLNQTNSTLSYIIDILRGINNKTIRDAGHHRLHAFNSCHQLTRLDTIDAVHETIEQIRPNQQNSQASTTDIHSFTLDKSEDTKMDVLRMEIENTIKNNVKHLSNICRNYLFKFLQQYPYDEKIKKFTNSFNMDSLHPFKHDLEAALASIDAFTAAWNGDKDTVLEFVNKYPTLKDKPGLHGTTLLYSAAKNNRETLVKYLIQEAHCAVNAQNEQQLEDVLQIHVSSTYRNVSPSAGSTALPRS